MNCPRPLMEPARLPSRNSSALSSFYLIHWIIGSRSSQLRSQLEKLGQDGVLRQKLCWRYQDQEQHSRILCLFDGSPYQLEKLCAEEHTPVIKQSRICGSVGSCKGNQVYCSLPVIVCMDNAGAIFMMENVSTSPRTKQVNICYHFVQEFIEKGFYQDCFHSNWR